MHLPSRFTRSLAAGAVLTTAALGLASTAPGAGAATPEATSALTWLAGELDGTANGIFVYQSFGQPFTDYGLSLDAAMSLALGGGHGSTVTRTMSAFDANVSSYISHPDFGSGAGNSAGGTAKALLAEQVTGRSTTVGGVALDTRLRELLRGSTPTARWNGRFDGDHGDFSNTLIQSLAVMALARTSGGVPSAARDFLLAQQCPNGGFRSSLDAVDFNDPNFPVDEAASTRGCVADTEADPDGTSFALQALLSIRDQAGVPAAVTKAIAFMKTHPATNANSVGLYGQALRGAGETVEADANATKVKALQLTSGSDSGAIALDADKKAAATNGNIADANVSQFWRATAQGVLALGLGTYGPVVADPATTTTSTTAASTTSTTSVSSTSSTAAGATTSTTAAAAASGSKIPKTGSSARNQALMGLLLVGLGLAAVGQSRLRDRRSS